MASALLAQLPAWRSVLQGLGPLRVSQPPTYSLDEEDDDSLQLVLVLDAEQLASRQCDAMLRIVSEALSALTLLARLDIGAWRKEVCAVWPQVDLQPVLDRSRRDIVMGLLYTFDTVASLDPLVTRMLLLDGYSPEFRSLLAEVKKETSQANRSDNSDSGSAHPLVPVSLTFVRPNAEQLRGINIRLDSNGVTADNAALEKVEQIVRVQTMNAAHRHRPEMVLKIASLELDPWFAFEPAEIALLGRLVQSGIHVHDLPVITNSSNSYHLAEMAKEDHDLTSGLRSLLAVTGGSPAITRYAVHELTLSLARSADDVRSLLSAVQQSQSLRSLTIEDVGNERQFVGDRRDFWRWVGFALLSPLAGHRIQRLELNLPHLHMSDVTAVQATTTASNPYPLLSDHRGLTLKWAEGTQFYVGWETCDGPDSDAIAYRTDVPIKVSVISEADTNDASWLMVRFPGCESAWIARSEARFLADCDHLSSPPAAAKTKPTFETVIFRGLTVQSVRANVSMLRFFGQRVKRLELHGVAYDRDDDDEWLHQVLMECPMLEELVIVASDICRLSPLLDYVDSRESRLRRLRIDSMRSTYDLYTLFHALSDPMHPLSWQLEEIDIDIGIVDHWMTFERIQRVFEAENHRIQVIRMRAKTTVDMFGQRRSSADTIFSSDANAPDTKLVYPLDRKCKLAVLGVVHRAKNATALGQLSSELLVAILDFASHVCFRKMTLSIT